MTRKVPALARLACLPIGPTTLFGQAVLTPAHA